MSETTKKTRREHWKGFNFAGTNDWAVDLQAFSLDDYTDPDTGEIPFDEWEFINNPPPALAQCDRSRSFDSLQQIADAGGSIPSHCLGIYTTQVLSASLSKAMQTYDDVIRRGYDNKFKTYANAVVKSAKKTVRDWMYKNGNTYFTCDVTEAIHCCDWCRRNAHDIDQCKYCNNKHCNGWSPICDQPEVICDGLQTTGWFNVSGPCPPDFSLRAGKEPTTGYGQTIYWKMKGDKEAEFWDALYGGTGIEKQDIRFIDDHFYDACIPSEPENCRHRGWDFGIPAPHGYEPGDVINPKDVVDKAYQNLTEIVRDFPRAVDQIRQGTYLGDANDLADAMALPVFMIEEAVENIKSISDAIDEAEEEKRKGIIMAFLTAILFFVPVVGTVASSIASLAAIGRIIALVGVAGNLALDIYSVVDSKGNDPMAIFALVLSPLAVFDVVRISRAASVARGMKGEDVAKLGKNIEGKMNLVKKARESAVCVRRTKRGLDGLFAEPVGAMSLNPVLSTDF